MPHLLPFAFGGVEVVHVLAPPFVQLDDPAPADRSSPWESWGERRDGERPATGGGKSDVHMIDM